MLHSLSSHCPNIGHPTRRSSRYGRSRVTSRPRLRTEDAHLHPTPSAARVRWFTPRDHCERPDGDAANQRRNLRHVPRPRCRPPGSRLIDRRLLGRTPTVEVDERAQRHEDGALVAVEQRMVLDQANDEYRCLVDEVRIEVFIANSRRRRMKRGVREIQARRLDECGEVRTVTSAAIAT